MTLKLAFIYSIISLSIFSKCQNKNALNLKAREMVEIEFGHIEEFLSPEATFTNGRYRLAIYFLEELTFIESESPANYSGKYAPTENDLSRWKGWYAKNRDRLIWIPSEEKIGVLREHSPMVEMIKYE